MTIRVGIIGCGRISGLHARAYQSHPDAVITAIADPEPGNRERRGEAWDVHESARHADYRDLLARDDVDVAEILVPHHLHAAIALEAMDAGKHVSLQKPMAVSLADADAMIARAGERGVVFKVFENFVFYPPVRRAKEIIESGEIGDIVSIRVKSNVGWSPTEWEVPAAAFDWRRDRARCGGGPLLFDDGHHKFAIVWYLLGLASQVHAFAGVSADGLWDAPSLASWVHDGGQVGSLEIARSPELRLDTAQYAQDDRIEVTGTRGVHWVTRGHGRLLDVPPVVVCRDGRTTGYSDMETAWEESFTASGRHFIDALLSGSGPMLTGPQGREILAFALAAQESASTGLAVALLPEVAAERVPFRDLDDDDLDPVRVFDPHLDQAPGLLLRLPRDGRPGLGQPLVLGPDVPDLHPDHGRARGLAGPVAGHLQHPLPEEEHHARIVGGPELPVDRQSQHVPVEPPAPVKIGRPQQDPAAQHLHTSILSTGFRASRAGPRYWPASDAASRWPKSPGRPPVCQKTTGVSGPMPPSRTAAVSPAIARPV